jgi:ArsR family transcriptional regulator
MPTALRQFKADLFQALAHPTRIAVLEALRDGEVSAGTLAQQLQVEQANLSQHLSVLRARHVVTHRKVGNQVFYAPRHPVLIEVIDLLKSYFQTQLSQTLETLEELGAPDSHRS